MILLYYTDSTITQLKFNNFLKCLFRITLCFIRNKVYVTHPKNKASPATISYKLSYS